jgi:glycosyltransferase involved in cell wall biosynthesis
MAQCPSARLVLVGSGPMQPALQSLSERLGVGERVQFISAKPLAELPALMNALDVLVLPSRTTPSWKEQFGRVIIEAQACGVPVIGSASGAIPEVIGDAGLVVAERDPAALAAALNRLAGDPQLARDLAGRGRGRVEERFTWARVAAQMREVYMKCMAQA